MSHPLSPRVGYPACHTLWSPYSPNAIKRHPRKKQTACLVCSDSSALRLSLIPFTVPVHGMGITGRAPGLLRFYAVRWHIEPDNFLLKQHLGLADFRLHATEAVQRWCSLVFAAYAFVRIRIAQAWRSQPARPAPTFQEGIAEQQRWYLEHLVVFVAGHARAGWSDERLNAHLLPTQVLPLRSVCHVCL